MFRQQNLSQSSAIDIEFIVPRSLSFCNSSALFMTHVMNENDRVCAIGVCVDLCVCDYVCVIGECAIYNEFMATSTRSPTN